MTRPAMAVNPRQWHDSPCRCLCFHNHPGTAAICLDTTRSAWAPLEVVDGVAMCPPCAEATRAD